METERTRSPALGDQPSLVRDPNQRRPRARRQAEAPVVDITPAEKSPDAGPQTKRPPYFLLPAIAKERRQKILELHHRAAAAISRAMRDYLREGDHWSFEGLSFLSLREVSVEAEPTALCAAFNVEKVNVPGVLLANAALTIYLARAIFAPSNEALNAGNRAPLSRLERALAGKAMRALCDHLGAFYDDAGVGTLRCESVGEPGESAARVDPEQLLMILRLRLGTAEPARLLTIAIGLGLLAAFPSASVSAPLRLEPPHRGRAAEVPVPASIVLGSWQVPMAELMELRVGDAIVLPDGDEAWLLGGGVRLQRVHLAFAHDRLRVSAKEGRVNAG